MSTTETLFGCAIEAGLVFLYVKERKRSDLVLAVLLPCMALLRWWVTA